MTVALVMMVKDEEQTLGRAIESAASLVDEIHVLDTGSTDDTVSVAESYGARVKKTEWQGFAAGRTDALALARDSAWRLMIDADMTVDFHPDLREWLDSDPDPDVNAWMTEMRDGTLAWRLPLLTRGSADARYEGDVHEHLVCPGKHRPLLGLTIHHHGVYKQQRFEQDIAALKDGVEAGDPRSVYYTAQSLKCLGLTDEAAAMYDRRAAMGGWEEERWHAAYMAAALRHDVDGLLDAFRQRPWRPEPLTQAAAIVRQNGARDDMLFLEQP